MFNKSEIINYMPTKQVNPCLAGLYLPCQLTAYSPRSFVAPHIAVQTGLYSPVSLPATAGSSHLGVGS